MGRSRRRLQRSVRPLWILGLGVLVGGLLLGCGRGSFIGRQYDDLTAYYNTFYNATQAFEEGLESVAQSRSEVDRTRYLSIFPEPQAGSAGSSFEEAIQKSADVLREHPNSEWVDDALLIIGRSRYYQQNYVGAVQKFREVIALEAEREGEARFRLAQTLVAADRFTDAAEALRAGLEREADYGTWTARMHLIRGELFVRQERWTEAEAALDQGLEGSLPDEVGARAAFLLGQVRETLEEFEGAKIAYERVLDYSPRYPLEFAARLAAVEMQGIAGDPKTALRRLGSLQREDDTKAMRGKIALVRARLYQSLGRPERAKQVLTSALRGEEAPTGAVQGRLHYDLGTLYRDTYEDFTQAAAHFDTAATTLSSRAGQGEDDADRAAQRLPRAPSDAGAQSDRFRRLADRAQAVARMDSLLRLGRMPRSEFQSFVEDLREQRRKEQRREAQAQQRPQQQFRNRGQEAAAGRRGRSAPSQANAAQTLESDAGFLFHRDPTLVQQGRRQFQQTWGDRPLVDDWRRVNAIQGSNATAAAEETGSQAESSNEEGASEGLVDLSAVPRDSARQAKMEKKRALARYELANALFRAAGRPDSAETWFRRILDEDENHPIAKQALYGLAQAYRAQGDTTAAEEAYRRIIEKYPSTPFAKRAREQLGLDQPQSASRSETSQADSAYAHAYKTWQAGAPHRALDAFLAVAETYPETSAAPRALLAAGVVYHRSVRQDTSGRLRRQFKHYLNSLAQSSSESESDNEEQSGNEAQSNRETPAGPKPSVDTTNSSSQVLDPRTDSLPDTPTGENETQPGGNTTGARTPSRPSMSSAQTPNEAPETAQPSLPDTSSHTADSLRKRSLRRVDSARVAQRDSSVRRSDRTDAQSSVPEADTSAVADREPTPDSVRTPQNATPDSTRENAGPKEPTASFRVLLTHLAERYGDTPVANRAQVLLEHLNARASPADSAASGRVDGTGASPDSVLSPASRDSTAESSDSSAVPSERPSADTTRAERDRPRQLRRRDPIARPARDSTSLREETPASRLPSDTTGVE